MTEATDIVLPADLPLDGLRIVELTEAGEVLAGASLPTSVRTSCAHDLRDDEESSNPMARFNVHNANKRVVILPSADSSQGVGFRRLVEKADILITALDPDELVQFGIIPDELWQGNPSLVITSITNFGLDGPYRDWLATDPVFMALNSELSRSGLPGRPRCCRPDRWPRRPLRSKQPGPLWLPSGKRGGRGKESTSTFRIFDCSDANNGSPIRNCRFGKSRGASE